MFDMRDLVTSFLGEPMKRGPVWYWWRCPLHVENKPSFGVACDHAHCYGCGWHGGWQRFASDVLGWTHAPRVNHWQPTRSVGFNLPPLPPPAEWRAAFGSLVAESARVLTTSLFAQKELERRCISPEIWQRYSVGYHPTWQKVSETKFAPGWVLPCWKEGKLWSVNVRVQTNHPKYHRPAGGCPSVLFGLDQLRGLDVLVICEGEFDALAVASQIEGVDVLALRGTGNVGSLAAQPLDYGRVITAMDGDEGGHKAMEELRLLYPQWEHRVLPDGFDVGKLAGAGVPLASFLLEGVLL